MLRLTLFRSVDSQKLMDEKEYGVFCGLDDMVIVYRGVTSHNAKNVALKNEHSKQAAMRWMFPEDGLPCNCHDGG